MSANDKNTVCVTCHTGSNLKGTMTIAPASTTHVNGTVDVAFAAIQVKSKAQLGNDITTVPELNNNWTRNGGYKASGSFDSAKNALNTSIMYVSGTKTCNNVACHNGMTVTWTATNISCNACHTALPQ
jgi:predicted CxxxxCH...CXXCH cytochrome family protein